MGQLPKLQAWRNSPSQPGILPHDRPELKPVAFAAALVDELRELAHRARYLPMPSRYDPDAFLTARGQLAKDLDRLAARLSSPEPSADKSAAIPPQCGKFRQIITGSIIVNGRRVMVQRARAPFAISA